MKRAMLFFVFLVVAAQVNAKQVWQSESRQTPTLELFTSHGCSSCPPADEWLGKLTDEPGLWQQWIPMAFHVDYWDYLGWQDRFADSAHSQRQRDYRSRGSIRSVYTPGFVVSGQEWRGWFRGQEPPLKPGPEVGQLVMTRDGERVQLEFKPSVDRSGQRLQARVALLGFGLTTRIGGGENSGRVLKDDFVVLASSEGGSDHLGWSLSMPTSPIQAKRYALVGWVSEPGDPTPLQAVGGWLVGQP